MWLVLFRRAVDDFVVFILIYIAYSLLHANRKAFSNLKPTITKVWTPEFQNESSPALYPSEKWDRSARLYDSDKDGVIFLGFLDSLFVFLCSWTLLKRMAWRSIFTQVSPFLRTFISSLIIFLFGVASEWAQAYYKFLYFHCGFSMIFHNLLFGRHL